MMKTVRIAEAPPCVRNDLVVVDVDGKFPPHPASAATIKIANCLIWDPSSLYRDRVVFAHRQATIAPRFRLIFGQVPTLPGGDFAQLRNLVTKLARSSRLDGSGPSTALEVSEFEHGWSPFRDLTKRLYRPSLLVTRNR